MIDIDEIKKILGEDKKFILFMMEKFISTSEREVAALIAATQAGDSKSVRQISHRMLGTVRMFVLNQVAESLEQLEQLAKSEMGKEMMATIVDQVCEQLKIVVSEMRSEIEKMRE